MTPFDPVALVAMLLAFYPVVTVENLQRARQERPAYFAGGRLFGSKGEKLELPDGRVFDLIFAAGGPASGRRWQALDVTNEAPGGEDPFALEEGPLVPLDEDATIPPREEGGFVALVSEELAALGATDGQLAGAHETALSFDGAQALDDDFERDVDHAERQHQAFRAALDGDDIADEIAISEAQGSAIDGAQRDYDEDPPADLPEPDPGHAPGDDEGPGDREPEPI